LRGETDGRPCRDTLKTEPVKGDLVGGTQWGRAVNGECDAK